MKYNSWTIGCKECGKEVILLEYENTIDAFCTKCECYKESDDTMMIPIEENPSIIDIIKYKLGIL